MALLATQLVGVWTGAPPTSIREQASRWYIAFSSRYLSEPYELVAGDKVIGTTEAVFELFADKSISSELEGKEITFILYPAVGMDLLFIQKKNWEEFREWGLVEPIYRLRVRLERAIRQDDSEVPLYTKKDKEL